MAELFRLVNYSNLPRYIACFHFVYMVEPVVEHGAIGQIFIIYIILGYLFVSDVDCALNSVCLFWIQFERAAERSSPAIVNLAQVVRPWTAAWKMAACPYRRLCRPLGWCRCHKITV